MTEEINHFLQIKSRLDKQPTPSYELGHALIQPTFDIVSQVSGLCRNLGKNGETSFPMEEVDGRKPEPVTLFNLRRMDQDGKPVETLKINLTDRHTVEVQHNENPIATFQADLSNPEEPKWSRVDSSQNSADDNLGFDKLLHSKITMLVNESAFREDPDTCVEIFRDHLHRHPIDEVFEDNHHNNTNNFANLNPN